ncbi:MAG: DUF92 domain-containing protein [Candidatus Promineifilaceae bacterium]
MSAAIVLLAYWRGSLSKSGTAAALFVGILIFGLGGPVWGILLGLFFVSSSLLSHFKEGEKQAAAEKFDKGHQRDAGQVVANGGLGCVIAVLSVAAPSSIWFPLFIGVMATVTADTWATELGTLSKQPPRLITNGRRVETGTSGGVSLLGIIVSIGGGILIGLSAGLLKPDLNLLLGAFIGGIGGLAGSLFDSFLGATVQQVYFCDQCGKDTEQRVHKCGQETRPLRGWRWLNNDLVNFLASIVGGSIAVGLWLLT